jgi:histidine triad (HIT) family protein
MNSSSDSCAMNSCVFCRIIASKVESASVGENELAIAFLDIRPVNRGHTVIVPRRHVVSLVDLTDPEMMAVFRLAQQVATALRSELAECKGITISAADGESAGQEVPHIHFQVIPRFAGDGFGWRRFGEATNPESLRSSAAIIRRSVIGITDSDLLRPEQTQAEQGMGGNPLPAVSRRLNRD